MSAAGNDFIIVDNCPGNYDFSSPHDFIKKICARKNGIGADGVLLLESSKEADIRMRIFNSDGSEAEMCGNGARCAAKYFHYNIAVVIGKPVKIQTKAGMLEAFVKDDTVRVKMSEPRGMRLNIGLNVNRKRLSVNYIDAGVPHVVMFAEDLQNLDIVKLGRQLRHHKEFIPAGANADFVKILKDDKIILRTYERGVESETLACGTGSVASAIITSYELKNKNRKNEVSVMTWGGEVLKVYFHKDGDKISNVWLEGSARIVYYGRFDHGF